MAASFIIGWFSFSSVMLTKVLHHALGGARVAVDLDEAVGEIHPRVVLHPGGAEAHPVGRVARLIIADQRSDRLVLPRLGAGLRPFQILVGFLQKLGVASPPESCRPEFRRGKPPPPAFPNR